MRANTGALRRRSPTIAVAVCTALVLAACNTNASNSGSQGKGSNIVNWYVSMPVEGANALAAAFTKSSGIKVNVQRIGSTELWQRFLTESNAHKYTADVLSIAGWNIVQDAKRQHLIQKIVPNKVNIGPGYTKVPGAVLPDGYAFSSRVVDDAIAYNTKLVPKSQAPKTWMDLAKPYWKGKIAMLDPKLDAPGYAADHQMAKDSAIGWKFFDSLKKQRPIFLSGDSGEILNRVVSGQSQVAVAQDVEALAQRAKGAPIALVYPPEGVGGSLDYNTLPSKAPHQANAVKLLKFLASAQGANALVKAMFVYSPRTGAIVEPSDRPKLDELHLLPFDPAGEQKDFKSFNARFNKAIGR